MKFKALVKLVVNTTGQLVEGIAVAVSAVTDVAHMSKDVTGVGREYTSNFKLTEMADLKEARDKQAAKIAARKAKREAKAS